LSLANADVICNPLRLRLYSLYCGAHCPVPQSQSSVDCRFFQASAVLCQWIVGVGYDRSICTYVVLLCAELQMEPTKQLMKQEPRPLISTNPWHHDFSRCKSYACLPFLSGVRPSKYVQHSSQLLEVHIGVPVNCISLSE
jgi:hypothetical protein